MRSSETTQFSSIWERASVCCSFNSFGRDYTFALVRTLSLFQTFFLIFGNINLQTKETDFWFQSEVTSLNSILGGINLTSLLNSPSSALIGLILICFYFVFIGFTIFKAIFLHEKEKNKRNGFTYLWFSSGLLRVHSELLIYPASMALISLLDYFINSNQADALRLTGISLIACVYVINGLFGVFSIIYCYSSLKMKDTVSRKGSFHLLATTTLKFVLPWLQSSLLRNSDDNVPACEIVGVVLSLVIAVALFIYNRVVLPEYNLIILKIHVIFDSFFVCLIVSQIFTLFIQDDGLILNVACVITPIWLKLCLNSYRRLLTRLTIFPWKITNPNHLMHLEILFAELETTLELNEDQIKYPYMVVETKLFTKHALTGQTEQSDKETLNKISTQQFRVGSQNFLNEIYEKFQGLKKRNILANLAYIDRIIKTDNLYPKAYCLCLEILNKKGLSIPDKVSVLGMLNKLQFKVQKQLAEKDKNSFFDAISRDLSSEEAFKRLQDNILKFTDCSLAYWNILKTAKPDLRSLVTKAREIEKQRVRLESQWTIDSSKFSVRYMSAYLLYGTFQALYMNLPWEGIKNIERYTQLMKNKGAAQNIAKSGDADASSVVITISSDKKTPGQIVNCSESVLQMLGIEKRLLLGCNVNKVMPLFFKERHDQFLTNYYETGKSRMMWNETFLYAKDSNHNIFPVSKYLVMQSVTDRGVMYSAQLKKIYDQNEYIFLTEDGLIQEVSVGIQLIFGIRSYDKTHIKTICPEYVKSNLMSSCEADVNESQKPNTTETTKTESKKKSPEKQKVIKFKRDNQGVCEFLRFKVDVKTIPNGGSLTIMTLKPHDKQIGNIMSKIQFEENLLKEDALDVDNMDVLSEDLNEGTNRIHSTRKMPTLITKSDAKLLTDFSKDDILTSGRPLVGKIQTYTSSRKPISMNSEGESVDNSQNAQTHMRPLFSAQASSTKANSYSFERTADQIQKMYQKPLPNLFRKVFRILFIILLIASLIMMVVEYLAFKQSIKDIDLAVNVMRLSYQRLIALCWVWRYTVSYKAVFDGIASRSLLAMQRIQIVVAANQALLAAANDELATAIANGKQEQQELFFEKNIEFVYDDSNDSLQERSLDSFEAINLFIQKLSKVATNSAQTLLDSKNAELDFIRVNTMNDLLITSENLIAVFEKALKEESDSKKNLLKSLIYSGILVTCFAVTLVGYNFYNDAKKMKKVMRAILAMHPKFVNSALFSLYSMKQILIDKEKSMPRRLHALYSRSMHEKLKSDSKIAPPKKYLGRQFFFLKALRCLVLTFFVFCFFFASFIELNSSLNVIDNLLEISNRLVVIPKAWYCSTLAVATLVETIAALNTTTMRNEPISVQLEKNIDAIVSNEELYDAFTDSNGNFVDSTVEYMFQTNPCPFVSNLPGLDMITFCIQGTNNQSVGLFGVNSNYPIEIRNLGKDFFANSLTTPRARQYTTRLGTVISPKANALIGSYSYINDRVVTQFNDATTSGLDNGLKRLIIEILFMITIGIIGLWYLNTRVLKDTDLRVLLKTIPAEEVLKNKLINSLIKALYKGSSEIRNIRLDFN